MRFALVAAAIASTLSAQVVRVVNYSSQPFDGWHRTTVDVCPPHASGLVGSTFFVRGRQIGSSTWVVDLRMALAPGEQRTVDLSSAVAVPWTIPDLGVDPVPFFGGWITVGGVPLDSDGASVDGSAVAMHFRGRIPPMFSADVWLLWRPDEPGLMRGECVVTASNPAVSDLTCTTPPGGIGLTLGDAIVHVPGAGWNVPVVPGGITMGNGQSRAVPVVLAWPQHLQTPAHWSSAIAAVTPSVYSVGLQRLLPDGNPTLPAGFSSFVWTATRFQEALRRLHTWEAPLIGPNPVSGDTGAQEDQVFVRGEPFLADGVGSEQMACLAAYKFFSRPCHHLEVSGRIVDPAVHTNPRLVYWDGKPHWNTTVSPDQLGKPRSATLQECNGWGGPDAEHWLINTLAAAARFSGSYALQWELRHQAMLYLGQATVTPGLSTSQPFAARAVGWEGIAAVHLWHCLEDRDLAERVKERWNRRVTDVILPVYGALDHWDVRWDDARLGPGAWWIPWQQSVGAYGLDFACEQLGPVAGRVAALHAAHVVMNEAWSFNGVRWLSLAQMPVAGGGNADESFNHFGMPVSVAVVLRHDPANAIANAIQDQLDNDNSGFSWRAPGVP